MLVQRGRDLWCTVTGAPKAWPMQPLSTSEPEASCHLLSILCPSWSWAGVFLSIHHSITEKEKQAGLFHFFFLSYCPGSSCRVKEMQVPQNSHFLKHKLQSKSLCWNSWSLLVFSHQLPLYLPTAVFQLSKVLQGPKKSRKWEHEENNGTNAWDGDGEIPGYHFLLLELPLGKMSCFLAIAP